MKLFCEQLSHIQLSPLAWSGTLITWMGRIAPPSLAPLITKELLEAVIVLLPVEISFQFFLRMQSAVWQQTYWWKDEPHGHNTSSSLGHSFHQCPVFRQLVQMR